jgi:hypothetical protein
LLSARLDRSISFDRFTGVSPLFIERGSMRLPRFPI